MVKAMPGVRSIKVPMMAWLVLAWASGQTNTQISVDQHGSSHFLKTAGQVSPGTQQQVDAGRKPSKRSHQTGPQVPAEQQGKAESAHSAAGQLLLCAGQGDAPGIGQAALGFVQRAAPGGDITGQLVYCGYPP